MTRNQIATALKNIASSHKQVKHTSVVRPDYFLHEIKNVEYPAVWFTMNNTDISNGIKTVNVVVTVADIILHPEQQNRVINTQSDMERIAEDLISQIAFYKQQWDYTLISSLEFFEDSYEDELAGCTFQIALQFPFDYDACAVPSDYDLPTNGIYINTNRFMNVADFFATQTVTELEYTNNLLVVPPFVFIDGMLITYQVSSDRRYIEHDSYNKKITIKNGVNEGENIRIVI